MGMYGSLTLRRWCGTLHIMCVWKWDLLKVKLTDRHIQLVLGTVGRCVGD